MAKLTVRRRSGRWASCRHGVVAIALIIALVTQPGWALISTASTSPLVGTWREVGQLTCGGQEIEPSAPFEELIFHANGRFSLTWFPFELYQDYWGTYHYRPETGDLTLTIEGGNYLPDGTDMNGRAVFPTIDRLRLEELFLGYPLNHDSETPVCGHVVTRVGSDDATEASLVTYDRDGNCRLSDGEFLALLNDWIGINVDDSIFFAGMDAWIQQTDICDS